MKHNSTHGVPASPAWCPTHQHYKWCEHNGGVMGPNGWQAPPGVVLPSQAALDSPSIEMPQGFTPEERRAFILGVAAAGKAGSGVLGTTLETPNTTDRIMRALNQPGLSESKLATTIPMGELIAFVEALPPTAGVGIPQPGQETKR